MVSAAETVAPWRDRAAAATADGPAQAPNHALNSAEPEHDGGFHPFGADGFSFLDLIDVVNPLQHIPVIGTLYRQLTGDAIAPLPRITGGALFFGPIGAGLAAADVIFKVTTGKDTGAHVLTMLRDGDAARTATPGPGDDADIGDTDGNAPGDDGDDPVTAWLRAETAYRAQQSAARDTAAVGAAGDAPGNDPGDDPVLAWARAEAAYRSASATAGAHVTDAHVTALETAPLASPVAVATTEPAKPASPNAVVFSSGASPGVISVPGASPGAVAPTGGWFSEAVFGALARHAAGGDGGGGAAIQPRQRALN